MSPTRPHPIPPSLEAEEQDRGEPLDLKERAKHVLPLILLLALVVHLVMAQFTSFSAAVHLLSRLLPWAVAAAALGQVGSYLGSGYLLKAAAKLMGQHLSLVRGTAISLGATTVGLVAGGAVGGTAVTYRWVRGSGVSRPGAALAGPLPAVLEAATLAAIGSCGLVYLLLTRRMAPALIAIFAGVVVLIFGMGVFWWWSLRHRRQWVAVLSWLERLWTKVRRKAFDAETTAVRVNRSIDAWECLRDGGWRGPGLGALINAGFDMGTLYFLFVAVGHPLGPGEFLAVYGLPLMLGKLSVIPGGIGLVEGSMAVLYHALGIAQPVIVVVILAYRLLSLWLPSLVGLPIVIYLQHRTRG
jgi:uncharacterized protein (TIRG00374 family)